VMTAVPQIKGTASLFRCFYKIVLPPGGDPELKKSIESNIMFGGDHYDSSSNKMKKIDISYECKPGINNHNFSGAKIKRLNCLKKGEDVKTAMAEALQKEQYANGGNAIASNGDGDGGSLGGAGR